MVASTCAARGVVYWLGSQLYVQLTNRARGLSLVASRGPAFIMPETSGFAPLAAEPSVDTVVEAVLAAYANDERKKALGQDVGRTRRADGGATDPGVAFAGLGDPLLRWPDVAEITRRVREHHEVPISLYTNGLLPPDAPGAAEVASSAAGVLCTLFDLRRGDGVPSTPLPAQDAARGRRHRGNRCIERGGPRRLRTCDAVAAVLRAGVP